MGFIGGLILLVLFLGVLGGLLKKAGSMRSSAAGSLRFFIPYLGFFVIAFIVSLMGALAGSIDPSLMVVFKYVSQGIVVLTGLALCVRLIIIVYNNTIK